MDAVKALYQKALDYVKENSFDLVEECAYKEWDEATAKRVQSWIDTVAAMQDPVAGAVITAQPVMNTTTSEVQEASPIDDMMGMTNVVTEEKPNDDLPF